jgi:hypothetical protein
MDTLLVSHAASNATSMDALVAALESNAASNATSMDALVAAVESNAASNAASMAALASIANSIADSIDVFLPVAKDAAAVAAAWTKYEKVTVAIDVVWLVLAFLGSSILWFFVLPHRFKNQMVEWLMGIIYKWFPEVGADISHGVNDAAAAIAEPREAGNNGEIQMVLIQLSKIVALPVHVVLMLFATKLRIQCHF